MMFTQQTEATTCPMIEPTISRGVPLHEESACKPGRGGPSSNKNAETHGYYRRKIKLEAVSFDDLNFSSSGGEQLRKRFLELLNHCGGEQFVSAIRRRIIERVCLHLSYACAPFEQIQLLTDMVSSQMRESLALNKGCTLAAYPCRSAAVRGIRARVVSFNDIHRSDHAFVVAAMYSASVGIGGLVGSRPIWSYSFLSMLTRASRSRTIGINVRLRRLTIRGPNSTRYKSRQSSWYWVKTTRSMMRRRTAETRCSPPQWFSNSIKRFRQLFAAARTEVQIFETDGF